MPLWPSDYIEKVVLDIENNRETRKVINAGFIERHAVKHCSPELLHPNPDDEFSQPEYGPNLEIVGKYVDEIKFLLEHTVNDIFEEPIMVQKTEPDGYMILNGHHRWFAALRMKLPKIHIKIVNMIDVSDVSRMMTATENTKLVSFDMDEVLLTLDADKQAPIALNLINDKVEGRLYANSPEIIKMFQENGYDVCVYTADYLGEDEIKDFFSLYGLDVNVIVNAINDKRGHASGNPEVIMKMLREKYKYIAHVSRHAVVFTDHETNEFEIFELDPEKDWKEEVSDRLSRMK